MTEIHAEYEGYYFNVYVDGRLRMSASAEHDEVLVYSDDCDEPQGRFTLSGLPKPLSG